MRGEYLSLQTFVNACFISCIAYRSAVYLSRYSDYLEDKGRKKVSSILSIVCYPLFAIGILGVLTLGALDYFENQRNFRRHHEQAVEIRALSEAKASHSRLLQYQAAAIYGAPGASAGYHELQRQFDQAKADGDDWTVRHLEQHGLSPDDPDYFDFDSWLEKEYYKLGL